MAKKEAATEDGLDELRSKLDWFDSERRKTARRLADLENQIVLQERELQGREQRIANLEERLAKATAQLSRLPQVDTQLSQFKDEMVQLIEQYDQRRVKSEEELDKVRRVEHEVQTRELADVRKELPKIDRLQKDLELRKAEEARLANLIGSFKNKLSAIENQIESWSRNLSFLEEAERKNARMLNEIQANFLETSKRWEPIENRLDITGLSISKAEENVQELTSITADLRRSIQSWSEQVQIGEYERNQRLSKWQVVLEEQQNEIDRFSQEFIRFSDQYKEAKMAVQTLSEWQKQIEQQQREASELTRVETNRMRSLWDDFLLENEKQWKSKEVDSEQRWSATRRQQRQVLEQIRSLEELLERLEQEKDTLWRIQSAQADAMKQLPRVWLEEVEKAIAQNPNSRRQPALVPVREE